MLNGVCSYEQTVAPSTRSVKPTRRRNAVAPLFELIRRLNRDQTMALGVEL
jgi:hypothetical protein